MLTVRKKIKFIFKKVLDVKQSTLLGCTGEYTSGVYSVFFKLLIINDFVFFPFLILITTLDVCTKP